MAENQRRLHPSPSPSGSEPEAAMTTEVTSDECSVELEGFVRKVVREEVEIGFSSYFHSSPSSSSSQPKDRNRGSEAARTTLKLKFLNQMPSTIFTGNMIEADDGEALQVALCDSRSDAIIVTGPLSSAAVELIVLNGDFGSTQHQQEETTCWTESDFDRHIVHEREGKRPLLGGRDRNPLLVNGVARIKNLRITDNSSWTRSKRFRLGARISGQKILTECAGIREAVSNPFLVKDSRQRAYEKHHPPSMEDEVWRLEGIRRDGVYHKRLRLHSINTVSQFLFWYRSKPSLLQKLLGNTVPKKVWKDMVEHALECVGDYTTLEESIEQNLSVDGERFSNVLTSSSEQLDPLTPTETVPSDQLRELESSLFQDDPPLQPDALTSTSDNDMNNTNAAFWARLLQNCNND